MRHKKNMNHISWNVTKRCNLYCKHCYRDSAPDQDTDGELSTDEGKKLLDDIKNAGLEVVVFSGGEPLLRPDIFDLVGYASSIGITPFMGSNGTLITKDNAKKLKEVGLKAIAISIDSLDHELHNSFRGHEDALVMALDGIKNCVSQGLKVQVNCTISKYNLDHIDAVMEYAESAGALSCHMLFLVDVGRGKDIECTQLDKAEYKNAINKIISKKLDIRIKPTCAPQYKVEALLNGILSIGGRGCIAGISYCSILPNGDVHICPYTPVKVDSIRERPFDEIWKYNEVFNSLRDFAQYKGRCGSCSYIDICGGCRARAFSSTGDWLEADPYCLLDSSS